MTNYVQTNEHGYVTDIVQEELLVGLFGGTKCMRVSDEQAADIRKLLDAAHRQGEGLHIDDIVEFKAPKK